MTKEEFLQELRKRLKGLPSNDLEERISFYDEAINDRLDDGMSEDEAISDLGGIDLVVEQIAKDTNLTTLVKHKINTSNSKRGKIQAWQIVLIILLFPFWIILASLLFTLFILAFVLVFILVIVAYALCISFIGGSLVGFVAMALNTFNGNFNVAHLGVSVTLLGLGFIFVFVSYYATILTIKLIKAIILGIKKMLIGGKRNA